MEVGEDGDYPTYPTCNPTSFDYIHHLKLNCAVKDWISVLKVRVPAKVQNVFE